MSLLKHFAAKCSGKIRPLEEDIFGTSSQKSAPSLANKNSRPESNSDKCKNIPRISSKAIDMHDSDSDWEDMNGKYKESDVISSWNIFMS